MLRSALMIDGTDLLTSTFGSGACGGTLLALENITTGLQEFQRVHRLAVHQHLVVQMRTGTPAAAPKLSDHGAARDVVPFLHHDAVHMAVPGDEAHAVVDLNQSTIAAVPAGVNHLAFTRT